MDKYIVFGGGDGAGGLMLAFQCASFIPPLNVKVVISAKPEVYRPLEYLFGERFDMFNVPEEDSHNNKILFDDDLRIGIKRQTDFDENSTFYYVCPDLIYRNRFAFDFDKFNTNPLTIKSTRLLTSRLKQENIITLALNSTTPGYLYHDIQNLVLQLANNLPNYTIYLPVVSKWAGHNIDLKINPEVFPDNVKVDIDPDFIESIRWVERSRVCICADNGISHLSFHLGQSRILLDPWFGFSRNTIPHQVRWRESTEDSIPIRTPPDKITDLIKLSIDVPQTQLLPKNIVLNNLDCNWARELLFKF